MIFAVIKLQPQVETGYSCVIIAVEIFIKLLYKGCLFKLWHLILIGFFNGLLNTDHASFALHWSKCKWEGADKMTSAPLPTSACAL